MRGLTISMKSSNLPLMNERAGGPGIDSNGDLTNSHLKTFHNTIKVT